MPEQLIIWTTLPNGRRPDATGERLKLSVLVSPRLQPQAGDAPRLQSFTDFLDWPKHARDALQGFEIIVDDGVVVPSSEVTVTSDNPDSELWRAIFPATTPVRSATPMLAPQPVANLPTGELAAELEMSYDKLGKATPYRPASSAQFRENFSAIADLLDRAPPEQTAELRAHVSEAKSAAAPRLAEAHQQISASLLRSDSGLGFEEKLAAATDIAGARARSELPGDVVPLVAATGKPAEAFLQFAAFHGRLRAPVAAEKGPAAPTGNPDDEIDFHRLLTALGSYPLLLRRLGLVFDLEVAASRVPKSSVGSLRTVHAQPKLAPPGVTGAPRPPSPPYTPRTKYILDDTDRLPLPFPVFVAAPRKAADPPSGEPTLEILGGLLNLRLPRELSPQDKQFDIISMDVDGTAKKVINALATIVDKDDAPAQAMDENPPPAINTAGLTLVRVDYGLRLMRDAARVGDLEGQRLASQAPTLFAEDLVRGYRIDVLRAPPGQQPTDPQGPWLSLHQRVGNFVIKRPGQSDLEFRDVDEGFVQPVVVQEPPTRLEDGRETSPRYVHDSYANWQGWSLSAPIPADATGLSLHAPTSLAPPGLRLGELVMEAQAKSLPRLRFGHSYQLRVRTVDLAGNGLTIPQADKVLGELPQTSQPLMPERVEAQPYRRFEPIAAPVLVPREELLEGEAIDVMVIRSNGPPTTTASYAAGLAISLSDRRYRAVDERHVAPPATSLRMAERHGRLDGAFGLGGDPAKIFPICKRDGRTLNDNFITNIQTGEREELPDVVLPNPATGGQTTIKNGVAFIKTAPGPQPRDGNGYTVHYEAQLRLPYLPDPLARGAALFALPGLDAGSLELAEGAGSSPGRLEPKPDPLPADARLALGAITKIGFPPASSWPEIRPFRLRLDGLRQSDSPKPEWSEQNGARVLTVRLKPADVKTITISSYLEAASVGLFGLHYLWRRVGSAAGDRQFLDMAQHGALPLLSPGRRVKLVHAVQQPLMEPKEDGQPFAVRKFAGETVAYLAGLFKVHGASTEKLDMLAEWKEQREDAEEPPRSIEMHVLEFPIDLEAEPQSLSGPIVPIATYKPRADQVQLHTPADAATARAQSWRARHEFGDTKHRQITYRLVATTRFREYFPEKITKDAANLVRTSTFSLSVPNSVRPPALEIASILPAFRWTKTTDLTRSARSGGWLRVYLGAKWFVTGEGEALAVVGEAAAGADPVHAANAPREPSQIRPAVTPVTIPELAGVNIYPFTPHFDEQRGWCVDLAFDVADAYFPFIRFKLARFQINSLKDLKLSPLVDAGFHQLSPNRTVTLVNTIQGSSRKLDITLMGTRASIAQSAGQGSASYSVEVAVEERDRVASGDRRDELLGWSPSTAIVPIAEPVPPASSTLWRGHVVIPNATDKDRRIVVKEFELYEANPAPPGQAWLGDAGGGAATRPSRRLVYADIIRLA